MRNRSFLPGGIFEHIELDERFPVTTPPLNVRGEVSPIPPHVHDCLELGYCLDGAGVFTVEGKVMPFAAGDAVLINHRELHQMVSLSGTVCRWRFCNLDPVRLLAGAVPASDDCLDTGPLCGEHFHNILANSHEDGLSGIVREIVAEMLAKREGYQDLVRALVWSLLVKLRRQVGGREDDDAAARAESRRSLLRVEPALRFIARNYARRIAVTSLARRCGLSPSRFRGVFRDACGLPPAEYLVHFRMKVAATLLCHTDTSILAIANASGYPTVSNFNRHFRGHFGCAPRQYRRKALSGLQRA